MNGIALKWVVRGITTTLTGAALSMLMSIPGLSSDRMAFAADAAIAGSSATNGPELLVAQNSPPTASPYLWSAEKAADGSVSFAGSVPSKEVRESLTDGIGQVSGDTTSIAPGEPEGFADTALAGLDVLADLDSGKIAFDGSAWSVTGSVDTAEKAKAAQDAFAASALKAAGATYSVKSPEAAATATTPAPTTPSATATTPATATTVEPAKPAAGYAWSAERAPDGTVSFTGSVPNPGLKTYLSVLAGSKAIDNSNVDATGAPQGFVDAAHFGVNALLKLESGKLSFADGTWSLTGAAKDDATSADTLKTLSAAVNTQAWKLAVETSKPVAVAAPPAAAAAPTTPAAAPAAPAQTAVTPPATVAAPATETPAAAPYVFSATRAGGGAIALSGEVPADATKQFFGYIAGKVATDGLDVSTGAPPTFIDNARGGIAALAQLTDGKLGFNGVKWSLTGKSATPEARTAVLAAIAALPEGKSWTADITGPTDIELCTQRVADLSKANLIAFAAGTKLAKGVDAALDNLATDLTICPKTYVDVEAYTDSDGDANANLALTVARSEAVVAALVKRGIKEDRLYAIGYGETLPLVPNTSKANKLKNRRIEIKILETPPN